MNSVNNNEFKISDLKCLLLFEFIVHKCACVLLLRIYVPILDSEQSD